MRSLAGLTRCFSAIAVTYACFASPLAASPPPLEAYGDLPVIEDVSISPSGKRLAFAGKIRGERRVMVLGEDRKLLGGFPLNDLKFQSIVWGGDELAIARLRWTQKLGMGYNINKTEMGGAMIVPADGGKPEWVFAKSSSMAPIVAGYHGTRFIDGKWIGYFGGVRYARGGKAEGYYLQHNRAGLFAVDLAANDPRQAAPTPPEGHWRDWLIDDRGEVVATLDLNNTSGAWEIVNDQKKPIAAGMAANGAIDFVSLNHDGTAAIYSIQDEAEERGQWMEVPLAGGEAKEILADLDIERVYVDHTNGRLLGYLPEDTQRPVLFDAARQTVLNKVYRAFPGLRASIVEWTPSFSHILVHTSGNEDSGTWFLVDMAQMKADPIDYDRPAILPEHVGPISVVPYKAGDGLEMDGILTLPPGKEAKNLPVVMFPHGGPKGHDEAEFNWWAQAFASRGYAVFQPNFRGSTNRDLAFIRAGDGEWGRKMQTDISDGLAALAERGIVDPKRACIMGGSYGGYAALAGVTLQQGLYRCAVAVAPVSDIKLMYDTDLRESNNNRMLRRNLLTAFGARDQYDAISPRRAADKADAPILLVHGVDDTRVPFNQSKVMAAALEKAGKPHELVVLKEEDHFLSRPATRMQMLEVAMRFVQQHNPAD